MSTIGLITALLLPGLLGFSWLQALWRNSHLSARLGYGYLLGLFAVTILLRIWNSIGLPLSFPAISGLIIVLSLIPYTLKDPAKPESSKQITYTSFDASWQKFAWFLLIAILIVRYGGILIEITWRPLYPWDAWMNWAPKAKTWFELRELAPFISRSEWVTESLQNNVYTLGNIPASTYPPLVPLIQTWTALGIGSWIDNLVNLPWSLCLLALGLSFYGQARMLGAKPLTAQFSVFLLLTVPYINVHSALAGYAELWLATFYCLATMAFINWSLTKDIVQAGLTLVFSLACIQTKEPGIIWAATFLPATILTLLVARWNYILLSIAIVFVGVSLYLVSFSTNLPIVGTITITPASISSLKLGSLSFEYHPVAHTFMLNNLIWGNWHMLSWLLLILFVPTFIRNIRFQALWAPSTLLLCGSLFIFFVFFFTSYYRQAIDNTTINRASLHLLPSLLYYLLLSYVHYMNNTLPGLSYVNRLPFNSIKDNHLN